MEKESEKKVDRAVAEAYQKHISYGLRDRPREQTPSSPPPPVSDGSEND